MNNYEQNFYQYGNNNIKDSIYNNWVTNSSIEQIILSHINDRQSLQLSYKCINWKNYCK